MFFVPRLFMTKHGCFSNSKRFNLPGFSIYFLFCLRKPQFLDTMLFAELFNILCHNKCNMRLKIQGMSFTFIFWMLKMCEKCKVLFNFFFLNVCFRKILLWKNLRIFFLVFLEKSADLIDLRTLNCLSLEHFDAYFFGEFFLKSF